MCPRTAFKQITHGTQTKLPISSEGPDSLSAFAPCRELRPATGCQRYNWLYSGGRFTPLPSIQLSHCTVGPPSLSATPLIGLWQTLSGATIQSILSQDRWIAICVKSLSHFLYMAKLGWKLFCFSCRNGVVNLSNDFGPRLSNFYLSGLQFPKFLALSYCTCVLL